MTTRVVEPEYQEFFCNSCCSGIFRNSPKRNLTAQQIDQMTVKFCREIVDLKQ